MTATASRRLDPVTIEDEEDPEYKPWPWKPKIDHASSPVDLVIDSFNHELEILTKSLDDVLSIQARPPRSSPDENSSYINRSASHYSFSSAKKPPIKYVKDPPPSADKVSPLRNYVDATPVRPPSKQRPMSISTPAEPPPAPVQTPGFPSYSAPAATPNRHREEYARRSPTDPIDREVSDPKVEDWEDALEKMRKTLSAQEERIRMLERENRELRKELKDRQTREEPPRSYGHERPFREDPSPYREPHPRNNNLEEASSIAHGTYSIREEPKGRRPTSSSGSITFRSQYSTPNRAILSPPKRIHTTIPPNQFDDPFSPGTKFVAELARLMKMEEGHHAPLSVILDKHWDQLKSCFSD